MSDRYNKNGLDRFPRHLRQTLNRRACDPRFWYYEEDSGLTVVSEVIVNGKTVTTSALIPKKYVLEYARIVESL
jgi:hypothetical protein